MNKQIEKRLDITMVGFLIGLVFIFMTRLLLAPYGIHQGDFGSWIAWGNQLWQGGFASYYNSIWSDRLPGGVLYLLWLLATIKDSLPGLSTELIYKLPANLADVVIAGVLFFYGSRRWGMNIGIIIGLMYALNPFTWHVSSLWGQMDSVQALVLIWVIYATVHRQYVLASFLFVYIFLFKPHSIVIAPLLWLWVLQTSKNWHQFIVANVKIGLTVLMSMWAMSIPFAVSRIQGSFVSFYAEPMLLVWERFFQAVDMYPYASVHAFNLWMIFSKNWVLDSGTWARFSYHSWGIILFSLYMASLLYILIRARKVTLAHLFLAAAAASLGAFMFLTRAHDKHFYTFFALFAFVIFERYQWQRLLVYVLMVAVGLTNTLYSFAYQYGAGPPFGPDTAGWISFVSLLVAIYLVFDLKRSTGV